MLAHASYVNAPEKREGRETWAAAGALEAGVLGVLKGMRINSKQNHRTNY